MIGKCAVVEEVHAELMALDNLFGAEFVKSARALRVEKFRATVVAQPRSVEQERAEHAEDLAAKDARRIACDRVDQIGQVEGMQVSHTLIELIAFARH